jgi:thioredoxin
MDGQILRCPSCGQNNRVPSLASGKAAVCGRCKTPLAGGAAAGHPIAVTDANFRETVAHGAFVVDFWAAWCGPCRMIAPILDELAAQRSDVRFAKLNVDENPHTAANFQVQGIPLLIFFENGVERGRLTGAVPKTHIEAAIARYLGR